MNDNVNQHLKMAWALCHKVRRESTTQIEKDTAQKCADLINEQIIKGDK